MRGEAYLLYNRIIDNKVTSRATRFPDNEKIAFPRESEFFSLSLPLTTAPFFYRVLSCADFVTRFIPLVGRLRKSDVSRRYGR